MGDLISDQNKSPFYVIDAHINMQKLQLKFTENELKSCIWTIHDQQSLRKFKSFIQYSVHWFKNIINIIFIIHISYKIWNYLRFMVRSCPKTDIQLVFCKLGLEHLQVHMGNYHIKICFRLVRYQIPQCYLFSKSKTNMKKWYFDHFTANSYLSFNKKDPVY